jgi:hypothetical protein
MISFQTPTITEEIRTMALGLSGQHSADAVLLAGTWQLCESALMRWGTQCGANVAPMLSELRECINARRAETGLSNSEFDSALSRIRQAGKTAAYLAAIPD